ncbi:hypothetical protein IKG60_00820 [Candidatus Saccharibacteria bacterium]|nr:hypothetical protein [Candidatus Saccharibacteria bacterium]
MFKSYQKFIDHERIFNLIFATVLSTVVVVTIGWLLAMAGFYNNFGTWVSILFLAAVPIIVFFSQHGRTDIKMAYYKIWRDKVKGIIDRRKILQNFAKKYNLSDWRTKLDEIKADGRWKFHADTNYMRTLTDERNILVNQIHQDCNELVGIKNDEIILAKRDIENANINLDGAAMARSNTAKRLELANTAAEQYTEYCNLREDDKALQDAKIALNNAEFELRRLNEEKEVIFESYRDTVYRVNMVYQNRYRNYTESAIKKINRINGLKYVIDEMPESDNNYQTIRKEQIWAY